MTCLRLSVEFATGAGFMIPQQTPLKRLQTFTEPCSNTSNDAWSKNVFDNKTTSSMCGCVAPQAQRMNSSHLVGTLQTEISAVLLTCFCVFVKRTGAGADWG